MLGFLWVRRGLVSGCLSVDAIGADWIALLVVIWGGERVGFGIGGFGWWDFVCGGGGVKVRLGGVDVEVFEWEGDVRFGSG